MIRYRGQCILRTRTRTRTPTWTLDVGYDVLAVPAVQDRCVARYGVDSGTVDGEPGPGDGFQVPGPGGGCLDGC